jgi:superfamily II DNA/RNA helicase
MPPGGSLAVCLATGEGKSLIFQLVARLGFCAAGDRPKEGLTVVVTPTVSLAIDHENAAAERGFERPIAYRGGDATSNAALTGAIEQGAQSLCIASPEAICGPLRGTLSRAAERGLLRALVVDEAHLIDGWGTGFRTEFQSLSGIRREWIAKAPAGAEPRTLLLSATLTAPTLGMLRTLFSGPGPFEVITAIRLRSEPDYWPVGCTTDAQREERVLEALRHVPRPAILYVTRVVDAEAWWDKLRDAGFHHIAMVHGETPGSKREAVLRGWRDGDIDLVVATSAFGLGIDYPHVRSVIHACMPESLDRFYQEVGRGGRDGRSCLSLLLHTPGDLNIARKICRALVISVDRGLQRWGSMYARRRPQERKGIYVVPLDVAPSQEPEDIDMRGERNCDWNARVLALMARAGLIELLGAPPPADDLEGPHEVIRILQDSHLSPGTWAEQIEPERRLMASASEKNLDLMMRFSTSGGCPAPLLLTLYGMERKAHACSRCALCRADPSARRAEHPPVEPEPPWLPWWPLADQLTELLDKRGRLLVLYDADATNAQFRRRLGQLLSAVRHAGVFNISLIQVGDDLAATIRKALSAEPAFLAELERLTQRRLPMGPHFALLGPQASVGAHDLRPRTPGEEQILMVPYSLRDPMRPEVPLSATYSGRTMTFDDVFARLCL